MSILSGKHILLGITAGIAAYKTASLVRLFVKNGAHVKVVMTPASKEFITPLTLSTLSKNPVLDSFTNEDDDNEVWNNHVELGLWSDIMIVAPVTANTLSKMVNGICDNLLLATYLSAKSKVYFAPAMDLDMYKHPSTQENIAKLQGFGNVFIRPVSGELASGLIGEGRMAEPDDIVKFIKEDLRSNMPLKDIQVLITAGPTYEAIDPVRFIGNHSSGKMGFELAQRAADLGATVTLVSGPTHQEITHDSVSRIDVTSADEMFKASQLHFKNANIAIFAAAVADYSTTKISPNKIKKKSDKLSLVLEPTIDILGTLGKVKKDQFLVGFALETEHEVENAISKIEKKNLDMIVLNSLRDKGAGFKTDTNKVTIIDKNKKLTRFELKSKSEVAIDIFNEIINKLNA